MATAAVRRATVDDATRIAELHAQTWRLAYADLLPAQVLADLEPEATAPGWQATIEADETTALVATEGDEAVGFCVVGPAPEVDVAGAGGELPADAAGVGMVGTLLVQQRWGRRGHGGRLLAAAAEVLRAGGCTRGIAWVPEADTAALAFYESVGWLSDGLVRTLDAGGTPVREVRMTGTLDLRLV